MTDERQKSPGGHALAGAGKPAPADAGQVAARHYNFAQYVSRERWAGYWRQVNELLAVRPGSILEIGVGAGILGAVLKNLGYAYASVDIDAALHPDYVATVMDLPFQDAAFDAVGCFQVLEHIRYEDLVPALREMARVSRGPVILSLPDARPVYACSIQLPGLGKIEGLLPRPQILPVKHVFDGQHYWEINKRGYPLRRIIEDINAAGLAVAKTYRVPENPYHRIFRLKRQ